jgi:hypothetical protein
MVGEQSDWNTGYINSGDGREKDGRQSFVLMGACQPHSSGVYRKKMRKTRVSETSFY